MSRLWNARNLSSKYPRSSSFRAITNYFFPLPRALYECGCVFEMELWTATGKNSGAHFDDEFLSLLSDLHESIVGNFPWTITHILVTDWFTWSSSSPPSCLVLSLSTTARWLKHPSMLPVTVRRREKIILLNQATFIISFILFD